MRFQLTKIIENRSPVVVTTALEQCLKQEAWEIRRRETQMIALGIGASRSKVNMSDKAVFEIDSQEGATTVQVEVEYQYSWFLSEESQNDAVLSRFETIFANTRAALALAPESPIPTPELQQAPTPPDTPAPPDESIASSETTPPTVDSALPSPSPEPTQPASPSPTQTPTQIPTAAPPIAPPPLQAFNNALPSFHQPHRPALAAVSLLLVSLLVTLAAGFGISHFHPSPSTAKVSLPARSIQPATLHPVPPPDRRPLPPVPAPSKADLPAAPVPTSAATAADLRRWLEQWAASERTRDPRTQASFYAEDVRPYLALDHASREAVYQAKQDAIQNRQGLWTFKIENISIQRQTDGEASVLLKKLVMTQSDSVRVTEQRISSFLTLKRTPDGWQITGERNLR